MFTLNRDGATLLLLGDGGVLSANPLIAIWTFLTACIAVAALAVTFGGWFIHQATMPERVLMAAGGLALLYASTTTDLIGAALLLLAAALHIMRPRRSQPSLTPST